MEKGRQVERAGYDIFFGRTSLKQKIPFYRPLNFHILIDLEHNQVVLGSLPNTDIGERDLPIYKSDSSDPLITFASPNMIYLLQSKDDQPVIRQQDIVVNLDLLVHTFHTRT
jgi:hypothetical protein